MATINTDQIDNIVIQLISSLDRNNLVHILLDTMSTETLLQNIILTKKKQDELSDSMGSTYKSLVCYECTEIYNRLQEILHEYKVDINDVL